MRSTDTHGSTLVLALTAVGLCLAQCGCVAVNVRLADFMQADRPPQSAVLPRGYSVQNVLIRRGDRDIGITHAHHPGSRVVIMYCGGDAFHRALHGGSALQALTLGGEADVILFDYPGYGETTGSPTPAALLETAYAVYDYALTLHTSAARKYVIYGFSLGGMLAAQIARDRPVHGLVLEATSPTVEQWARSQIPLWAKPFIKPRVEPVLAGVNSTRSLAAFGGKVLVLAGGADRQAPAKLSARIHRELRAAGVHARYEVLSARHGEIMRQPEFGRIMRSFLAELEARQ